MGEPKRLKKLYKKPIHPWQKSRLVSEREIVCTYGLRNKRELWRVEEELRKYRREARAILAELALNPENEIVNKRKNDIVNKLVRYGILKGGIDPLDEILSLDVKKFLERRLQTIVYTKGLASTPKGARQLIVHGHIAVNGRRISSPSYLVGKDEEDTISFAENSPFKHREVG
ncbi:MAG: 30S ribosomal protein S4 [Candidatus Methanoliparum thermophilum]|uniref:Small ribosomal subunit protein uS4 n=1 Tax=Methanoliparum thermophilum TaxID=2491083 RepID=A0A520KUY3_METT2|nr:30S ribosomal protein S4 [Candidatus Methanoliparum sp. LAM-1]RZN65501.1 MAG: 30S ribosomal protein S4 [Candidatus Methanoliparum thermophilum]BDC35404.1 30S ribosomal protein S4 [Candidatus Methanoliparum sp. LAM-1]